MVLSQSTYQVDPTPRRADGEFMAHARITISGTAENETEIFMSGDLAGFDDRAEAIAYATNWTRGWIDDHAA